MLTHSLELAKNTIHTRQWGENIHLPMGTSETKGGWVDALQSLLCLLWISVSLYSPRLYILGPLSLAPPILSKLVKPGKKYWDRFQLVLFSESYGSIWDIWKFTEVQSGENWNWKADEVGQVAAAFSYKPFFLYYMNF